MPINKDPVPPLLRILSVILPVIIASVSATIGIMFLLKEPPQRKPAHSKNQTVKTDTNIYKPKNQK